jgi:hypothetical protein
MISTLRTWFVLVTSWIVCSLLALDDVEAGLIDNLARRLVRRLQDL